MESCVVWTGRAVSDIVAVDFGEIIRFITTTEIDVGTAISRFNITVCGDVGL
jgi:hypothetical protein